MMLGSRVTGGFMWFTVFTEEWYVFYFSPSLLWQLFGPKGMV